MGKSWYLLEKEKHLPLSVLKDFASDDEKRSLSDFEKTTFAGLLAPRVTCSPVKGVVSLPSIDKNKFASAGKSYIQGKVEITEKEAQAGEANKRQEFQVIQDKNLNSKYSPRPPSLERCSSGPTKENLYAFRRRKLSSECFRSPSSLSKESETSTVPVKVQKAGIQRTPCRGGKEAWIRVAEKGTKMMKPISVDLLPVCRAKSGSDEFGWCLTDTDEEECNISQGEEDKDYMNVKKGGGRKETHQHITATPDKQQFNNSVSTLARRENGKCLTELNVSDSSFKRPSSRERNSLGPGSFNTIARSTENLRRGNGVSVKCSSNKLKSLVSEKAIMINNWLFDMAIRMNNDNCSQRHGQDL